jgi:hypothetical protein
MRLLLKGKGFKERRGDTRLAVARQVKPRGAERVGRKKILA